MEQKQTKEEYARAIYNDIYSIYEQSLGNYHTFATEVTRKYKLHHIMLVCNQFSITHSCIKTLEQHNDYCYSYYYCHCCEILNDRWSVSSKNIMYEKISDIFIAFKPPEPEYILK
jgi:hypothetical protein